MMLVAEQNNKNLWALLCAHLQYEGADVAHAVGKDNSARQSYKDDEDSLVEGHWHNVPIPG